MKSRITLLLTAAPVYDLMNPASGTMHLTGMLLEDARIIAELTAPRDTPGEVFCTNAIQWAEGQLKARGLKIDLVCGDAALRPIVEARGLKYYHELRLTDPEE